MDHNLAFEILQDCALRRAENCDISWCNDFEEFRHKCKEAGNKTMVAVLGTAILAKATDVDVSPFALRVSDNELNGYSARGLAQKVLAKHARPLKYNIESSSPEPLNNQPWFHSERISENMKMHKKFSHLLPLLLALLARLDNINSPDKLKSILCSYLNTGKDSLINATKMAKNLGSHSSGTLLRSIEIFVEEKSEHGKRAQAVAAGLADWFFGKENVSTKKVNDPSRKTPGDILILTSSDGVMCSWEVKDKIITDEDVMMFLMRLNSDKKNRIKKACMIAVDKKQKSLNVRKVILESNIHNVQMRAFSSWRSFLHELIFWSDRDPDDIEKAYDLILQRLHMLETSEQGIKKWTNIKRYAEI